MRSGLQVPLEQQSPKLTRRALHDRPRPRAALHGARRPLEPFGSNKGAQEAARKPRKPNHSSPPTTLRCLALAGVSPTPAFHVKHKYPDVLFIFHCNYRLLAPNRSKLLK